MGRIIIKTPVPAICGRHWELEFTDGVAETNDPEIARKYEARGYTVEWPKEPAKKPRTKKE